MAAITIVWIAKAVDEGNLILGVASTEDGAKALAQNDFGPTELHWSRSRKGRLGWRSVGRTEDGTRYEYVVSGWEVSS